MIFSIIFILFYLTKRLRETPFDLCFHLRNTGQYGGVEGVDINIYPAWEKNISGKGVKIMFVTRGCNVDHNGLSDKFLENISYNFIQKHFDVSINDPFQINIGTGEISISIAGNYNEYFSDEIVGPAYGVQFGVIASPVSFTKFGDFLNAISYELLSTDIRVYPYFPTIYYLYNLATIYGYRKIPSLTKIINHSIIEGRDGKGVIHVLDPKFNGANSYVTVPHLANILEVITVSSSDYRGFQTTFDTFSAGYVVNAPTYGNYDVFTADNKNQPPFFFSSGIHRKGVMPNEHSSTAGSLVAGIIALVLEVNPELNWRDIQWILIKSATKNDPESKLWKKNAAGYFYHPYLGFGLVDANASVELAKKWDPLPNASEHKAYPEEKKFLIPFARQGILKFEIEVESNIDVLDFFYFKFNTTFPDCTAIRIILESPQGTKMTILNPIAQRLMVYSADQYFIDDVNQILVRSFFHENPNGMWKVTVIDSSFYEYNFLSSVELQIFGLNSSFETPEVQKRVVGAANYPVINTTDKIKVNLSTNVWIAGENVSFIINYPENATIPFYLVNKSSGNFMPLSACKVNATCIISVPSSLSSISGSIYISFQLRTKSEFVFYPIDIINNDEDNSGFKIIEPVNYENFATYFDQYKEIKFRWKSDMKEIPYIGDNQNVILNIYDYPAKQTALSLSRLNHGSQSFLFTSSLGVPNNVVVLTPQYQDEDDFSSCNSIVLPLHFIISGEKPIGPFSLTMNDFCPIPDGVVINQTIPSDTPSQTIDKNEPMKYDMIILVSFAALSLIVLVSMTIVLIRIKCRKSAFEKSDEQLLQ